MTELSLIPTDQLIDELESRFAFFIAVWANNEGQYRRSLKGDTNTQGFAAIGCLEWAKHGVMQAMHIAPSKDQDDDRCVDPEQ